MRHGLTTVSRRNPNYHDDILAVAKLMCADDGANDALYDKAVAVAECDIHIREIRAVKLVLISRLLDPDSLPLRFANSERKERLKKWKEREELGWKIAGMNVTDESPPEVLIKFDQELSRYYAVGKNRSIEHAIIMALPDMLRILRYERRVWSRRHQAFLEFMGVLGGYSVMQRALRKRLQTLPGRED
jgi:hypothetical protein